MISLFFIIIISYRPCCDFHPISVSLSSCVRPVRAAADRQYSACACSSAPLSLGHISTPGPVQRVKTEILANDFVRCPAGSPTVPTGTGTFFTSRTGATTRRGADRAGCSRFSRHFHLTVRP